MVMGQKVKTMQEQPIFNNLYMSMLCAKHVGPGRAFKHTKAKVPPFQLLG